MQAGEIVKGDMVRVGGHVEIVDKVLRGDGRVLLSYVSGAAGCVPPSHEIPLIESASEHEAWRRAAALETLEQEATAGAARHEAAIELLEGNDARGVR